MPGSLPPDHQPAATALLVIDVQEGMFRKSTPVHCAEQMLSNINLLIGRAREAGVKVIFIQHCDAHFLVDGTPDWQLHSALELHETDVQIKKQKSNAFEGTSLDGQLQSMGITHLVVTGMVTHGCVKNTCLGAVKSGYQVVLVGDAHSSFSKEAAQLIDEWNTKLGQQGVTVLPSSEIFFN